jgi:hypothetical protein
VCVERVRSRRKGHYPVCLPMSVMHTFMRFVSEAHKHVRHVALFLARRTGHLKRSRNDWHHGRLSAMGLRCDADPQIHTCALL